MYCMHASVYGQIRAASLQALEAYQDIVNKVYAEITTLTIEQTSKE